VKQKQSILKKMEDLAFMFREGSLEPTQAQLNQLNSVFSGIFHVEHRENRRVFGSFFTDERFQMNWAEDSLYTVEEGKKYFFIDVVAEVYRLVYNEMHKHSGDFRLQGSTIDGYMRSGEFPNFLEGRTPEDFIVDFPTTTNCRGPQCAISGGFRRKTSRTKRRTHKKNQSRRKQNSKKF
jgi:hypothetical protein